MSTNHQELVPEIVTDATFKQIRKSGEKMAE